MGSSLACPTYANKYTAGRSGSRRRSGKPWLPDDTFADTNVPSRSTPEKSNSLLLAAGGALLLALARDDLAKHHHAVAVHEGHTRQALAILEGVADQRLLRLEAALCHLVGLQGVRALHLLAARLLAHLPLERGDTASRTAAADETDRRVADLDLVRDVQHLDLRVELPGLPEGRVLLVHHHVAGAGHVVLVQALDVQAHVVARVREVHTLVVHLHGEALARARVRRRVRRQEDHLLTGLHHALLDTAQLVQDIVQGVAVDRLLAALDVLALPPSHVVGLLQQVVAHPARNRQDRRVLLDEILLPTNLHQHALHLVRDLVVPRLLVRGSVAIHLVHADRDLLHAQQVDQTRVLARLALDLAGLVVALGDGRREVTVRGNHDQRHVRLRRAGDHVLDEVAVARGIDDGVVPLLGVELLGGARDGHAALTLLLLAIHVEREGEGALAQALGLGL